MAMRFPLLKHELIEKAKEEFGLLTWSSTAWQPQKGKVKNPEKSVGIVLKPVNQDFEGITLIPTP